ncbi:MAG: hypothetical protein LBE27_03755 [Deltaproteobacteria bacterium]|nr:hypothetical protein [Deltaproteobacteria bacterium]
MNFESFFGLKERPFKNSQEERFFFPRAVFKSLCQALEKDNPPKTIVLAGPLGVGKTLSMLCLPYALGKRYRVALCLHGSPTLTGILGEALNSLGLEGRYAPGAPEETLLGLFQSTVSFHIEEGLNIVLAVDDSFKLSSETINDLQALVSLEPEWKNRATLLLGSAGSPHLEESNEGETLILKMEPLSQEETSLYLRHRLMVAGKKAQLFSAEAVKLIWGYSQGSPVKINDLAERSLMTAWAAGKKEIAASHVTQAKASLDNPMRIQEESAKVAAGGVRTHHQIKGLPSKTPLITLGALIVAVVVVTLYLLLPKNDSELSAAPPEEAPLTQVAALETIPAVASESPPDLLPDLGLPTPPSAILMLPRNALALVVDRSLTMSKLWQGGLKGPGLKAEVALPEITAPGLYLVGRPQSRTPLIFQYPPAKEIPKEASLRLWKQVESFLPQDILPLVVGNGSDLKKPSPAKLALTIKDILKVWTQSQELKSADNLALLYAPEFQFFEPGRKDKTISRENFRQALISEMRSSGDIQLTVSEPLILLDPRNHNLVWAVFSLKYDSRLRHDIGLRTLIFERKGADWLITAELWIKEVSLKT